MRLTCRLWDHFEHRLCRPTLELAERLADGLVQPTEQNRAWLAIKSAAYAVRHIEDGHATWAGRGPRYVLRAVVRDVVHTNIRQTIKDAMWNSDIAEYLLVVAGTGDGKNATVREFAEAVQRNTRNESLREFLCDIAGGPKVGRSFDPNGGPATQSGSLLAFMKIARSIDCRSYPML